MRKDLYLTASNGSKVYLPKRRAHHKPMSDASRCVLWGFIIGLGIFITLATITNLLVSPTHLKTNIRVPSESEIGFYHPTMCQTMHKGCPNEF